MVVYVNILVAQSRFTLEARTVQEPIERAQSKLGGLLSRGPGQILFYDRGQPYFEFTNFSDHPIRYNGKDYPTSEHLFQSLKRQFEDNTIIEMIRTQPTPRAAFDMAQKYKTSVRQGWHDKQLNIKTMEKAILLKFTQHEDLRKMLVSTGDALLKENSPTDRFWGIGADGQGENRLGLALMKVRELLKTFDK
ncbi:hypothetical protein Clacol_004470 [Clathrus columnatus]|uniref:NADAR domain-containing protein n=1 Tax=Clathrus columnatus TaxID=1419009 RepID=A0AAV5A6J1_9AGAM|nr:hypothetical protein Clacol_004470 [Clathrus columnatus]